MSTRYKLLKDLPGLNAGQIFVRARQDFVNYYAPEYRASVNHEFWFPAFAIENNPDWFQKVVEPIVMSCGDKKWWLREVMNPLVHINVTGDHEEYLPPWHDGKVVREYWRDGKLCHEIEYSAIRVSGKFYAFEPPTT